jgi:hypothetical protein
VKPTLTGLDELLVTHRGLRIVPVSSDETRIRGPLSFRVEQSGLDSIADTYEILLDVPRKYPSEFPTVSETAGRISPKFHKLNDRSLCLASPTRIRLALLGNPSLLYFVEYLLVPYLYGHSFFERFGVLPFGELPHGRNGLVEDIASLLAVQPDSDVEAFVALSGMRRRAANKRPCPCGSSRKLGRCHNTRLNALRKQLGRSWFREILSQLETEPIQQQDLR